MSDLTSKGIPLLGETDADKRATLNAALQKVDQLLGVSGGGTGAVVTTSIVPASRESWTDTGIVLNGSDALTIEASGNVSHYPGVQPYPIASNGFLQLHAVVVAEGTTPFGDYPKQNSYQLSSALSRKAGRVWVRVRDVATYYDDNTGTVTATLNYYADASKAVAPAVVQVAQIGVAGLTDALAAKADISQTGLFRQLLPRVTTTVDSPQITLQNIPQSARHLVVSVRAQATSGTGGEMRIKLNGNANGESYQGLASGAVLVGSLPNDAQVIFAEVRVFDYSANSQFVGIASIAASTGGGQGASCGVIRNAPAVTTSLSLSLKNGASFSAGATLDVYGIF